MKRLFIDLEICSQCKECLAECSYFYYPKNLGVTRLRELGAFLYICRKCEEAPCVKACPKEALERQEDGILKESSEKIFFNADSRKSNTDGRRFSDEICENPRAIRENLRSEKVFQRSLKRYVMRCISCKSCSFACPFGTIPPDVVPYIISRCDVCLDRIDKENPLCTRTCNVINAVKFIDIEESKDKDIFLIGDNIAIHAIPWKKYHP